MILEPNVFNTLKEKVKQECLRRSYVGSQSGSQSVAEYGGTDWDYINSPESGHIAAQEHLEKIATPMHAINSVDTPYTSGDREIIEDNLTALNAKVTLYMTRQLQDSSGTDCSGGCTGLCYGCVGSCTGGCSGTCSAYCAYSCNGDCYTTCTGGCKGGCSTTCTGGCQSTCSTECTHINTW